MTTSSAIQMPFDPAGLIDLLARHPLPLAMNQIEVAKDGVMRFRQDDPFNFKFSFCGAQILAACRLTTETMTVALESELGPLPYSVQSVSARQGVMAMLGEHGGHGRFELAAQNMIKFHGQVTVSRPFTPDGLVTELTAYMLECMPQFERLAEILAQATAPRAAVG